MLITRVMPCLLMSRGALVKTVNFKNPTYVGDPVNAVRIFNQKEVDELILLDITASSENTGIDYDTIEKVVGECFMPITYGGGVSSVDEMRRLYALGIEKISLSTTAVSNPNLVQEAAKVFGNQSVVVTLDVKKTFFGKYTVRMNRGREDTKQSVADIARQMQEYGAGELVLYSIDRDGTWSGFDLELIRQVTNQVTIPVIATGGAGKLDDLRAVVKEAGASAVAIGSMAVFQGKDLGVLIKFPKLEELVGLFD
jgi:cyclase